MSTLTRSSWGLSTPRTDVPVTPCAENPAAWDIPSENTSPRQQVMIASAAVVGCVECPIRGACARSARDNPPEHDTVQAGVVFWRGAKYTLAEFTRARRVHIQSEKKRRRGGLSNDEYETRIRELVDAGLTDREIGRIIGATEAAIKQQRRRMGLFRRLGAVKAVPAGQPDTRAGV